MVNQSTMTPLACAAVLLFFPLSAQGAPATSDSIPAAQPVILEQVVVTAPQQSTPLTIVTDPRQPRQPIPAQDGADYLKTIPGFSVIRKGGADGDPVLRGMAGSRLNILLDGQQILGGCGGRMDPPTAYVYPGAYDRITVIKGPQTVLYGPGNSAGTVLFERSTARGTPGIKFDASLIGGSFGRNDELVDFTRIAETAYVRATLTRSEMGDYRDGGGAAVHSSYRRWSANAALGWTLDDDTLLELSLAQSDGRAAYADRSMDGARFRRDNIGLRFERRHISPLITRIEAQAYRNYVDHVMDNFSLRSGNPAMLMAMNPDRITEGGRLAVTLMLNDRNQLITGFDLQKNTHTGRGTMHQDTAPYQDMPRVADAEFDNAGWFGEWTHALDDAYGKRLIAGLRLDRWHAEDRRAASRTAAGAPTRNETLRSGFGRYEQDLSALPLTLYAGLGYVERFPDYWELISKQSADSASAFDTKTEKTSQLDFGALYKSGALNLTASMFYNRIADYIQIQSQVPRGGRMVSLARNIDAESWGGEFGAAYALNTHWTADASLAYVRGNNRTDHTALAQIPPLETRFGLNYDDQVHSFGALLRLVARQDRFDLNKGNIAGQDLGPGAGFGVFSLNGGWKPAKRLLLTAGIDNLFNKTYAEHLSRGGAMLAGYDRTLQINEPGRMLWLKAQYALD
jgi:iron complex outermembrane receptor protein